MRTNALSLLAGVVPAVLLTLGTVSPAFGADCTPALLNGLYVYTANGFSVPTPSGPALPKAIVELIRFNGDGTVSVPGAAVSLNGTIVVTPPGGTGTYTVVDLVPKDDACVGNVTFSGAGAPSHDFVASRSGQTLWLIQANANNVFQGTATRLSP